MNGLTSNRCASRAGGSAVAGTLATAAPRSNTVRSAPRQPDVRARVIPRELSWSCALTHTTALAPQTRRLRLGARLLRLGDHQPERSEERRVGKGCRSTWSP